jgi:hypothetical protein
MINLDLRNLILFTDGASMWNYWDNKCRKDNYF